MDVVLCKLREVNLKLNLNKCCFAAKSITFLGHVVSESGITPYLGKIEAVLHFPQPKMVTNVRLFLGLTWYYRNYVRGYARPAAPLFELTKRDVNFVWDMGCQQAFQALKAALVDLLYSHDLISGEHFVWTLTGHPRVLEPYCHRRKENLKGWWFTPVKV